MLTHVWLNLATAVTTCSLQSSPVFFQSSPVFSRLFQSSPVLICSVLVLCFRRRWMDVRSMGYSWLAAHKSDIHPSQETVHTSLPITTAFMQNIKVQMNPFCATSLKLTISVCHTVTMALTGFTDLYLSFTESDQWCIRKMLRPHIAL